MRSNISTGAMNLVPVPNWLVYLQCVCFSILFGIWVLPETILVRHICLVLGALSGLYVIYQNRHFFLSAKAVPIWMLVLLFAWALFHLFFLGQDFDAQWQEWTTIWKRSAIGLVFAVGLGLSLASQTSASRNEAVPGKMSGPSTISWRIIFIGLALPTLIYWMKFGAGFLQELGLGNFWESLLLQKDASSRYFIHKSAYAFFCLPLLAVSLGRLYQLYLSSRLKTLEALIYITCFFLVLLNFIHEKDRNGEIYTFFLSVVFCGLLLKAHMSSFSRQKIVLVIIVALMPILAAVYQYRNNPQWNSLFSDAEIAIQIDKYNNWQDQVALKPPKNKEGKQISGTNYERIAWGTAALRLVGQNPLGYGLVERSFGHLGMKVWPQAKLHQSHSGWLDFTLGMGIPGTLLLLGAGILAWAQTNKTQVPWGTLGWWGLSSLLLLLCTTELSQKVYIDALIFLTGFVAALSVKEK